MSDIPCPACGAKMVIRQGRKTEFYGCPRYPRCTGIRWMNDPVVREARIDTRKEDILWPTYPADPLGLPPVEESEDDLPFAPSDPVYPSSSSASDPGSGEVITNWGVLFSEVSDAGLRKLLDLLLVEAGRRGIDLYEDYSKEN